MTGLRTRKVVVPCGMTFLYRVIVDHEAPDHAYEAVAQVGSPSGAWTQLLVSQLQQAGIAFEPC